MLYIYETMNRYLYPSLKNQYKCTCCYCLFLSDIFVHANSLVAGHYEMDSVAKEMTFLRGMDFEGNITGTYLLHINENQIQKIVLFTGGSMDIEYLEDDILLDFSLYTTDSTLYRATYQGPATYR